MGPTHGAMRIGAVFCGGLLSVIACGGDGGGPEPFWDGEVGGSSGTASMSEGSAEVDDGAGGGSTGAPAGDDAGSSSGAQADESSGGEPQCDDTGCDGGGLGIAGERFTVGGEPRFLLGASYFSCLYASEAVLASDFDFLAASGVEIVRCWVNWPIHWDTWATESPDNVVLVRADGSLDPDGLAKLQAVVELAEARGIFVDFTFNQDTPNKPFAAHRDGIVATANAFAGSDRVLFDLQNETDHSNNVPEFFMNELQTLEVRDAVRAVDPARLLTASTRNTTALAAYTIGAQLDLGAYHCCRNTGSITDWAAATFDAVINARDALGPGLPIYMQEPNRCGSGDQYATCNGDGSEFVTAAVNAKAAGAAAWVLHTTAGYDLRTLSLQEQLTATELDALQELAPTLAATRWGP